MRNSAGLSFLLLAWLGLTTGASVTNLKPGDLAFVGYQMDGPTDRVAFVTLVALSPGTAISLNDNGWNSASNTFRSTTEDTIVWSNNTGTSIEPLSLIHI